jgi:excinuclease ABC subunit C
LKSELVEIPGIGPKTTQRLLSHFGSLEKVRQAAAEELQAVVNKRQSEAIRKYFAAM